MKNNAKKDAQLGMAHGTAANRLRKTLLFKYVTKCSESLCFRCGHEIDNVDNFTIDHKIAWLDSENPVEVFFDLDNVAFSHTECNYKDRRFPARQRNHGRTLYDSGCRCEVCVNAKSIQNSNGHRKIVAYGGNK